MEAAARGDEALVAFLLESKADPQLGAVRGGRRSALACS
jgi:hypothetical protein